MLKAAVRRVLDLYPRLFMACHTRHVRDPQTKRLVSAHQAGILDHLDAVEPTTLSGLARHTGVTPGTMSLTVDRLEAAGYVARARDAGDGRVVNLRLTEAGERLRGAQSVLDPGLLRGVLARLGPADRAAAVRGLEILARAALEGASRKTLSGLRVRGPGNEEGGSHEVADAGGVRGRGAGGVRRKHGASRAVRAEGARGLAEGAVPRVARRRLEGDHGHREISRVAQGPEKGRAAAGPRGAARVEGARPAGRRRV
ncbi:MAG: winged helix-turn-helix transcriptional regulator [Planctomycetes bacterium]|nr:winged helix-turn-helix transcriptional regulator [Planctomycetota bacterium]